MEEQHDWVICVVALVKNKPREYKPFYLGVRGTQAQAHAMQDTVAKNGFTEKQVRYFPDQIESLTLKKVGDETDEQ